MRRILTILVLGLVGLAQAQTIPDSKVGLDLGIQVGDYTYREHPNFMELHGSGLLGLHGALTVADLFGMGHMRFEGRVGISPVDYSSESGTSEDSENFYGEFRTLWLTPIQTRYGEFIPYFGLGVRRLYNDLKDTEIASGYERISTYVYAPLGFAYHSPKARYGGIGFQGEYGPLLWGQQYSDIGSGLTNDQTSGYHARTSVQWESDSWRIGPYYQFWKVDDSDVACSDTTCGLEPKNFTREYGLSFNYKF